MGVSLLTKNFRLDWCPYMPVKKATLHGQTVMKVKTCYVRHLDHMSLKLH